MITNPNSPIVQMGPPPDAESVEAQPGIPISQVVATAELGDVAPPEDD